MERALGWIAPLVERLARSGVVVEASPLPAAETHAIALRRPGLGPRAALVLDVDDLGIEVALELPSASPEIDQLRAHLRDPDAAESFTGALGQLPEPIALIFEGEPQRPVHDLPLEVLERVVLRAFEEPRRLRIGFRVARAVALEELQLAEQLEGALAALAVPFALLEAPLLRRPPLFRRALPRARDGRRIVIGSQVRVRTGPFEGQDGVVETLDSKGGARVRLGLLFTRLDVAELSPARTTGRPPLIRSHRRGTSRR